MKAPHVEIAGLRQRRLARHLRQHRQVRRRQAVPADLQAPRRRRTACRSSARTRWPSTTFPTTEDRADQDVRATSSSKMIKDKKIIYMAPGPIGRLRQRRPARSVPAQLVARVALAAACTTKRRAATGCRCRSRAARASIAWASARGSTSTRPASSATPAALLGCREISVGYGYASGQAAIAHFGLGKEESVDVEVILPHGKGKLEQKDVKANQRIVVKR